MSAVMSRLSSENASGGSCPALGEASQACNLVKILLMVASNIGCSIVGGTLCDHVTSWAQVMNGKARPVLASQRYLLGMTGLIQGYSKAFYNRSDASCKAGCKECCAHQHAHFPGPEADSYLGNAAMAGKLAQVPSALDAGTITRRNMLGYLLINDMFWYDLPEGSRGLGLGGQAIELHRFVRPVLDKAFGAAGAWDRDTIRASVTAFLKNRTTLRLQEDAKVWTQQTLHKSTYGVEISTADAEAFVAFQSKVLLCTVVPQDLVDAARQIPGGEALLHLALGFDKIKAYKDAFLQRMLPLVRERFGTGLNDTQLAIVNSNLLDGLVFAGGLSIPGVIGPAVAALYAPDSPAADITLSPANAKQFAWEATRYFPPVLGFPFVNKSKALPLQIMAVGMGQRAADGWGEDAERPAFRLRSLATYHKYWVGHADHAFDPAGKMTRSCPGKMLSMTALEEWFLAWEQMAWAPAPKTSFKFHDVVPFEADFTMVRADEPA